MNIIYQAHVTSTDGRDGRSISDDNKLDIALNTPKELGGPGGEGSNPEQLFAAGYSACFIGAMQFVAAQQKFSLPRNLSVTADVGIGDNPKGVGSAISVNLSVNLPGLMQEVIEKLVDDAHHVCPYSNATRGNIEITTTIK